MLKAMRSGVDVSDMRPSEIAETVAALHEAIGWIGEQEQTIKDLRKEVNAYRLHLGYPPKKWGKK